jgi:hypothetical protein
MLLLGMPFYVTFVHLPQRFQAVNFTSAERAGILRPPATLMTPTGAMFSGVAEKKILVEFVLVAVAAVVFIGVGLISSLPTHEAMWSGTDGYLIAVVLGPPYFMLIVTSIAEKDTVFVRSVSGNHVENVRVTRL